MLFDLLALNGTDVDRAALPRPAAPPRTRPRAGSALAASTPPGRRATVPDAAGGQPGPGPRGHHGQAPRQPLPTRQALAGVAEGEEPPPPGAGDRGLDRGRRAAAPDASARCWSAHYEGDVLRYAGGVGTGFTEQVLRDAHAALAERTHRRLPVRPPAHADPAAPPARPLGAARAGRRGRVRRVDRSTASSATPSYLGLRDDKDPGACVTYVREPGCGRQRGWPASSGSAKPKGSSRRLARISSSSASELARRSVGHDRRRRSSRPRGGTARSA